MRNRSISCWHVALPRRNKSFGVHWGNKDDGWSLVAMMGGCEGGVYVCSTFLADYYVLLSVFMRYIYICMCDIHACRSIQQGATATCFDQPPLDSTPRAGILSYIYMLMTGGAWGCWNSTTQPYINQL